MITQESLEQLKQVADIVEVVQHYLELKRAGNLYVAICPFHNEKSPSFTINPMRNSFKCFGCGKAGNAITFVMEYEKLDFVEATKKLASMFSVPLEFTTPQQKNPQELDLLEEITRYYEGLLEHHKGAQEYLVSRGLSLESIRQFRLGFCVGSRVLEYVQRAKLDKKALLELGVLGQDEQGHIYARFAKRLIFPIHSPNGKIVGFGGRVIEEGNIAKYINSPQSALFNKSKLLYGYFQARQNIAKSQQLILTEGYLDVILLHQAGFKNAVATLGTALTEQHLPLLERFGPDIILGYDGDKAGRAAALKGARMLATANRLGGVVLFENGLDPADLIAQGQVQSMGALLNKPTPFAEHVIRAIYESIDRLDPLFKQKALQEMLDFTQTLPPLLQADYRDTIARLLNIPPSLVPMMRYKKTPSSKWESIPKPQQNESRYIAEALILKYLLNDASLLERVRPFLTTTLFKVLNYELLALLAGRREDPKLLNILLDSRLPMHQHGFKEEFIEFLLMCYKEQRQQINTLYSNLDAKERMQMFMDLGVKIKQLRDRKGEYYESLSVI
ncbi:DNA primase [Helicobacter cynogastricus]|uniref:DNA primase n=1 Tax=Helicobacter cynogastricus TaxID=329937 RepID=UPI000CF04CCB|nr:DNA primase [Helicobacter cynogastricus]